MTRAQAETIHAMFDAPQTALAVLRRDIEAATPNPNQAFAPLHAETDQLNFHAAISAIRLALHALADAENAIQRCRKEGVI